MGQEDDTTVADTDTATTEADEPTTIASTDAQPTAADDATTVAASDADTTEADEPTTVAGTDEQTEANESTAEADTATSADTKPTVSDAPTNAPTEADESTAEVDTATAADTAPTVSDAPTGAPTVPPVECKKNSCADPNSQCTVEDDKITCPCKDGYETNANGACICNTRLRPMEFLCDTGTDTADQDYFDGEESSAKTVESTMVSMLAAIFLLCFMN